LRSLEIEVGDEGLLGLGATNNILTGEEKQHNLGRLEKSFVFQPRDCKYDKFHFL
jgi:hypothetical protein